MFNAVTFQTIPQLIDLSGPVGSKSSHIHDHTTFKTLLWGRKLIWVLFLTLVMIMVAHVQLS